MTIENGNVPVGDGEVPGGAPAGEPISDTPPAAPAQDGVTLTNEQYATLLDHVASLESRLMESPKGRSEVQTLDNLIDEADQGRPAPSQAPPQGVKLEDMTPDQVIGMIYHTIKKEMVEPLEVKVETLRLMNEIDKVANKKGNEDFWEYANAVKEIALKNPTLTIQRAYQLAKAEGKRGPNPQGDQGLTRKSDVLFTLPKRPVVPGSTGERPSGPPRGMTQGSSDISRRDAASEAFDKAMKSTK